jgi:Methylase involved in ubiquinone/menaquinone biosynthesis
MIVWINQLIWSDHEMGREFIHAFDQWAGSYDQSVAGKDPEYREVFHQYDTILAEAAEQAHGTVLEFGPGTGNLSRKLLARGLKVFGVEPSKNMRKIAAEKVPEMILSDGDFLNFPVPDEPVGTITSSYAFHHLTNTEKDLAIHNYSSLLADNGRIVFADTLFDSEFTRQQIQHEAKVKGYFNLLKDLQTEYYPLRKELYGMFRRYDFVPYFRQMNEFVWLIVADKNKSER